MRSIIIKHVRIFITAFCLLLGLSGAFVPAVASAVDNPKSDVCAALGSDANCAKQANGSISLDTIIKVVINILSIIVGVISVIMIMLGGFKYVTSGGDSGKVKSAKESITYAIVGVIIVALAQVIVKYVLAKVTGNK